MGISGVSGRYQVVSGASQGSLGDSRGSIEHFKMSQGVSEGYLEVSRAFQGDSEAF